NQTPDTKTTAMRMMNIRPAIKTYPQVEVTAENDMLYGQIKSIAERIQAELRRGLKNTELTLSLRLAEQTEMKPKPSKGEILEKMKKNNPAIGLLFNTIDLELS
ncbi:MAG: DNA polymerase III subunit gamma/tau, partial [Prevotella sp.]|nr:DNA polymerase III subunit gamma/tau [Prevotella sp.]